MRLVRAPTLCSTQIVLLFSSGFKYLNLTSYLPPASLACLRLLTGTGECPQKGQLSQRFTMATPKSDLPSSPQKVYLHLQKPGEVWPCLSYLPSREKPHPSLHFSMHSFFFPRWLTMQFDCLHVIRVGSPAPVPIASIIATVSL